MPSRQLPGSGLFGWLGRQVGYVARAIRHPVSPHEKRAAGGPPEAAQTIYRDQKVLEEPMPGKPQVTLRRTVIDEAIVGRDDSSGSLR